MVYLNPGNFMHSTIWNHWLSAILVPACLMMSLQSIDLAVGDPVPPFTARDQFGKEFKFEPGLRFLLLGFDRNTGQQANLKLADLGSGWLEKHGAVYVLDIHSMPAVARWFAFPKMRKYPFRIVLADSETLLASFPRKPERITVLVLNPSGKISEICYWNPAAEKLESLLR
jgi:hypothetical protein